MWRYPVGGLMLLMLAAFTLWQVSRARCFSLVGEAICHVQTTKPIVALTFDDGPTAIGLHAILPSLAQHHVHATFFLIGNEIAKRPQLAALIARSGNELGNHSYSHRRMIGYSQTFYRDEVMRTDLLIRAAGGTPRLFRPPNGKKLFGLPSVLRQQHRAMILWDVEDPLTRDPTAFARAIVREAKPGSIILIHAMYRANATARQALPQILDGLEARGLKVVTVGQLLAERRPTPRSP